MDMEKLIEEERFDFVSKENKIFILEFTKKIRSIDYDFDGDIRNGFNWGNYQIIYSLNGIRGSRNIIARIFIRDDCVIVLGDKENKFKNGIALRLYFSNINKHINYIKDAPMHIKERFVNNSGMCKYCVEQCYKRKTYTIDGKEMIKCRDIFEYDNPKINDIEDYLDILKEFYGKKGHKNRTRKELGQKASPNRTVYALPHRRVVNSRNVRRC
jgi:hypothetical protein